MSDFELANLTSIVRLPAQKPRARLKVMLERLDQIARRSRIPFVIVAAAIVALTGVVDYVTGFQIFFSVFYLLGVAVAAWFVGKDFALFISLASVAVWIGGDVAAGAQYSNSFIPVWNALILLSFYFVVVWLLGSLRSLQRDLESRVSARTRELTREISERQRLEKEVLEVSEREQRRIGHDLHDGLCQHLTGTALAGQVLQEKLSARALPEAADASKLVRLVEQGIVLARSYARGLYPVEMEAEGLMAAFQQLADNISQAGRSQCRFDCANPVLIHDDAAATHLYRIAQEAVLNAMRHGKAAHVGISLSESEGVVKLTVEDDGIGLPETLPSGRGLGIRIMAYRASMIGGNFSLEPAPTGGTIVTCSFPSRPADSQSKCND